MQRPTPTRKQMEDDLWLHANISEPDLAEMSDEEIAKIYERLQRALQVRAESRLQQLSAEDQAVVRDVLKQHPKLTLAKALDMLEEVGM